MKQVSIEQNRLAQPSVMPTTLKRHKRVLKTWLGMGLMACVMSAAQAQTVMKINVSIAKDSHQGTGIDAFAKELEKRTQGRYKIETFYAGSLGGERESVESVQLGTQALTMTSTGPLPNFVPELRMLDVPFLFRDKTHARAVLAGPIGQELLAKFEPKGFKALAWAENGVRHMTNNKREIKSPEDLKGLKLRTMENSVHIAAFKDLGVLPTPMPYTELFTALQQGTVDGQENPLTVIMTSKFDQVQKYMTLTSHIYSPSVFLMNKAMFDKLSDADKQAFIEAAKVGSAANNARVDADDAKGVAELRNRGMTVLENVDKSKFVAMMTSSTALFEKQFGKENLDRIRNYK